MIRLAQLVKSLIIIQRMEGWDEFVDSDVPGSIPIMSFHGENTTDTSCICIGCILPMGGIKGPYLGEDPCHLYIRENGELDG